MNYSFFRILVITLIGFSFAGCNQKGTVHDPGIDNKCIEDLTSSCLVKQKPYTSNSKPKFKWKFTWVNSSGSHEECYIEETSTEPNKTINLGNADKVNIYVFAVDKVDGIKYLNLYNANQLAEHKEALPPNQNKEVGCEIIALKVIDVQPNNTYTFHAVASSYFGSGYSQSQFIKIVRPLD